jgi:maltooligosyltrehalose trehalohydrolase
MPFGAEFNDDGSVRFRLWAPKAREVDLCIKHGDSSVRLPMQKHYPDQEQKLEGWFEVITDQARAGTRYQFRIGDAHVPDPASRFQPQDVHGPSEVIDPHAFDWQDEIWRGRPWEEAVIYELHVGAFTSCGTFAGVRNRLDDLADLGVTALELMPLSDFPGKRNWGYDGVFPYAPDSSYGRPEDLKQLIQAAHARGLMVLLDVVYNHFGPEGNYLGLHAPQFFTDRHHTPWGNGINFDGPESRVVRDFFIHNALYWLNEYHFDGLRLDAVHAIADDSTPDILTELAETVRNSCEPRRYVHLILENDRNQSTYLRRTTPCTPRVYSAQWNDDIHHALHVLITNESDGYYCDYSDHPLDHLGRCLTSGFAYQGEASRLRDGQKRGESTVGLPPTAFVSFLQNHDQIGNRALGERLIAIADPHAVQAAVAILMLAPSPPLLFMGEEFGARTPFLFFCDFEKDLAVAVTEGRRDEFARFARFADPAVRERIPDPNAVSTFKSSRLDWAAANRTDGQAWLHFYKHLLDLRQRHIVPRLADACRIQAKYERTQDSGLKVRWDFPDAARLTLLANLGPNILSNVALPESLMIYSSENIAEEEKGKTTFPAWSVMWSLKS